MKICDRCWLKGDVIIGTIDVTLGPEVYYLCAECTEGVRDWLNSNPKPKKRKKEKQGE